MEIKNQPQIALKHRSQDLRRAGNLHHRILIQIIIDHRNRQIELILELVINRPMIQLINIRTIRMVQLVRIRILIELIIVLVTIIIHVLQIIDIEHRLHLDHIQDGNDDDRGVVVDRFHLLLVHLHLHHHVHRNHRHPVHHRDLIRQVHHHLDRVHHVVRHQIINDRMIPE